MEVGCEISPVLETSLPLIMKKWYLQREHLDSNLFKKGTTVHLVVNPVQRRNYDPIK